MKIAFGSDERTVLTDAIERWLLERGHEMAKFGHLVAEAEKWKWADIGRQVAESVARGDAEFGILCCWSGTGVTIAANRIRGARAALCWDAETARLARKWDDANILTLSLRFTSETLGQEILEAWFGTAFDEEGLNQAARVDQ
jgi:ribose 5-phosphate isomerase B